METYKLAKAITQTEFDNIPSYSDVDSGCYDDFIQESGNRE